MADVEQIIPREQLDVDPYGYYYRGDRYHRVGTVLRSIPEDWIDQWRKKRGDRFTDDYLDATSDMGTLIHRVTELYDTNRCEELQEFLNEWHFVRPFYDSYVRWRKAAIDEVLAVEFPVRSPYLPIAGTIDRIVRIRYDDGLAILDIKTGSSVTLRNRVQANAYRAIYNEAVLRFRKQRGVHYPFVRRCLILHMPRDIPGKCSVSDVTSGEYMRMWHDLAISFCDMEVRYESK